MRTYYQLINKSLSEVLKNLSRNFQEITRRPCEITCEEVHLSD